MQPKVVVYLSDKFLIGHQGLYQKVLKPGFYVSKNSKHQVRTTKKKYLLSSIPDYQEFSWSNLKIFGIRTIKTIIQTALRIFRLTNKQTNSVHQVAEIIMINHLTLHSWFIFLSHYPNVHPLLHLRFITKEVDVQRRFANLFKKKQMLYKRECPKN